MKGIWYTIVTKHTLISSLVNVVAIWLGIDMISTNLGHVILYDQRYGRLLYLEVGTPKISTDMISQGLPMGTVVKGTQVGNGSLEC